MISKCMFPKWTKGFTLYSCWVTKNKKRLNVYCVHFTRVWFVYNKYIYAYLYVYIHLNLFIYLSCYLSICLFIYQSISLSTYIYLTMYLSIYLAIYIYLATYKYMHMHIHVCVCLSIYCDSCDITVIFAANLSNNRTKRKKKDIIDLRFTIHSIW